MENDEWLRLAARIEDAYYATLMDFAIALGELDGDE